MEKIITDEVTGITLKHSTKFVWLDARGNIMMSDNRPSIKPLVKFSSKEMKRLSMSHSWYLMNTHFQGLVLEIALVEFLGRS